MLQEMDSTLVNTLGSQICNHHHPPVARLKRRILSRRTGEVQNLLTSKTVTDLISGKSKERGVRLNKKRPKSSYGRPVTPVSLQTEALINDRTMVLENDKNGCSIAFSKTPTQRQRPKSSYGIRRTPVSFYCEETTNAGIMKHQNAATENLPPRSKTPQPRQRVKTYLERWKEAQFESRPCTAMGLVALEREQISNSFLLGDMKARTEPTRLPISGRTQTKTDPSLDNNPETLLEKMRHLKEVLETAKEKHSKNTIKDDTKINSKEAPFSSPNIPSKINDQRERLKDLIRNSKDFVTERHQTSLGSLSSGARLVNGSSNNTISRFQNESRKSVTFDTRPITPWIIARPSEQPCIPGDPHHPEMRPQTPGITETITKTNSTKGRPRRNPCDTERCCNKQIQEAINTVQSVNSDNQISTDDTKILKRHNLTNSQSANCVNVPRRTTVACSRYVKPDSDTKIKPDPEDVPKRSSSINTNAGRSVDRTSEWTERLKGPNTSRDENHVKPFNQSSTNNRHIVNPGHAQTCAGSITNNLPPKTVQGKTTVDQLKERYYQARRKVLTPTLSQPMRCQSTPITRSVKSSRNQESGKEDAINRDDRILSWLGDCEESSVPTHLPIISFNDRD